MSEAKVKQNSREIRPRVWLHKPSCRLGYGLPKTWLGDLWFFAEHSETETLDQSFCNFLDDPRDEQSLRRKDFVDLGDL